MCLIESSRKSAAVRIDTMFRLFLGGGGGGGGGWGGLSYRGAWLYLSIIQSSHCV